eukprot:4606335-Amphidinium_carterae.1
MRDHVGAVAHAEWFLLALSVRNFFFMLCILQKTRSLMARSDQERCTWVGRQPSSPSRCDKCLVLQNRSHKSRIALDRKTEALGQRIYVNHERLQSV